MRALIVLVLLLLAPLAANAQTYCGLPTWMGSVSNANPNTTYPSREAAQAACNSVTALTADPTSGGWFARVQKNACTLNVAAKNFTVTGTIINSSNSSNCGSTFAASGTKTATGWAFTGDACPAGSTWDANTQTCFSSDACKAKPALGPTFTGGASPVACVDGCKFSAPGNACVTTSSGSACVLTGAKPTGQACAVGDAPPIQDKPQQCTPNGEVCIKPDGQHCMSASNGRQICWRPGETGEKDDGPVKQKRDAGTNPIAPNLQLPSGDNLQPSGPPIQSTTTNNNTTITTVTQNYQTQHGTNAGSSNAGESGTGDGSGKEGDGDGDGSASGGENCEAAPVISGDPVLAMVATQAWATRCAVEAGNAAKVTGDIGDCAQAFTVEGSNANAQQLRAMRAQICGDDTNGNKRPDWTETNGTEEPGPGEGDDEPGFVAKTFSLDNLDSSGFLGGAGSCPQMGVVDLSFTQVDLSNASWWCPFVTMCRGILLLMGFFISVRLLME